MGPVVVDGRDPRFDPMAQQITVRVNGQVVNSCYDATPAAGKILLQSEGFELFVRRFELHPLNPKEEGRP